MNHAFRPEFLATKQLNMLKKKKKKAAFFGILLWWHRCS